MAHAKPYYINPAFVPILSLFTMSSNKTNLESPRRPLSLTPTVTLLLSESVTKSPRQRPLSEVLSDTKVSPNSSKLSSTLVSSTSHPSITSRKTLKLSPGLKSPPRLSLPLPRRNPTSSPRSRARLLSLRRRRNNESFPA